MTKRFIKTDDFYAIKCVGAAQVSPDGRYVAYVVQRLDREEDKSTTDIYLWDLKSRNLRRLTNTGKESSPRFSPDGLRLAFVSSRTDKSQIWILELAGGEAWRLPTEESVGGAPIWSPDGKQIAYTASVYSKDDEWQPYPGAPAGDAERLRELAQRQNQDKKGKDDDKKLTQVKVITRFRYRADGAGHFNETRRHVFIAPVPEAAPLADLKPAARQITQGDYDHGTPAFSPDGKYFVLDAKRSDTADYDLANDIWLVELTSRTYHKLYDAPGPASSPQFSPSGLHINFVGHDNSFNVSTTSDLWLLPVGEFLEAVAKGEEPAPLTVESALNVTRKLDRPVGCYGAAELRLGGGSSFWAGDNYYFLLTDRGASGIYKTDMQGQISKVLVDEQRAISSVHGDSEASVLVFTESQPDKLEALYMLQAGEELPLPNHNEEWQQEVQLGPWEKIVYNSDDGQEVDGWVIYPPHFESGRKYPLGLLVHGGPHGAYGPAFMYLGQLLAAEGYVVLFTNPRGSETYGQQFACCIDKNWGDRDYADVMAGVDAVIERGLVDPEQLFVHGWSYGGYMTCWLVTQTPRFKAACAGASVTNMLSGYGTSDIIFADEHEYGGQPWRDGAHLLKHSPLTYAERVETPLLLLHGENDLRCPIGQAEEFYAALRRMSKNAVMIRYPGEFHGLRRPLHRLDRYNRIIAWFNHYRS